MTRWPLPSGSADRPRPPVASAQRHGRTPSSRCHRHLRRLRVVPGAEGGRVAKKNERDNQRRAVAEQLRKQQQRKERQRSLLILGACIAIVVGLLAAALIPYIKNQRDEAKAEGKPVQRPRRQRERGGVRPDQDRGRARIRRRTSTPARRSPTPRRRRRSARTGPTSCRGRRSGTSTPRATVPRSSDWCTASSTATRSSGTTRRSSPAPTPTRTSRRSPTSSPAGDYFIAAPWNETDGGAVPVGQAPRADALDRARRTRRAPRSTARPRAVGGELLHGEVPRRQRAGARRPLIRSGRSGRGGAARRRRP